MQVYLQGRCGTLPLLIAFQCERQICWRTRYPPRTRLKQMLRAFPTSSASSSCCRRQIFCDLETIYIYIYVFIWSHFLWSLNLKTLDKFRVSPLCSSNVLQEQPKTLDDAKTAAKCGGGGASRAREIYGETYSALETKLLQLQLKGRQAAQREIPQIKLPRLLLTRTRFVVSFKELWLWWPRVTIVTMSWFVVVYDSSSICLYWHRCNLMPGTGWWNGWPGHVSESCTILSFVGGCAFAFRHLFWSVGGGRTWVQSGFKTEKNKRFQRKLKNKN